MWWRVMWGKSGHSSPPCKSVVLSGAPRKLVPNLAERREVERSRRCVLYYHRYEVFSRNYLCCDSPGGAPQMAGPSVRKHGRVPSLFYVTDFGARCKEKEAKFEENEFCKAGALDY